MKRQPGFISTQLHRGVAGSGAFLNCAVSEIGRAFSCGLREPGVPGAARRIPRERDGKPPPVPAGGRAKHLRRVSGCTRRNAANLSEQRISLNANHPAIAVGRRHSPLDWSNRTSSLPNGSRTRAHGPIAMSNGRCTACAARASGRRRTPHQHREPQHPFRDRCVRVHDELRVRVRKSKADRLVAPPQHPMSEAIAIERYRGIEIGDAKQKVVEPSKQRAAGAHA